MSLVRYNEDEDPTENGVYACRVPSDMNPALFDDKFLVWMDGRWGYPRSDQWYRGEVAGWVGPLQRRMTAPPAGSG